MNWLKRIIKSKISITIITPNDDVQHTTTPRQLEVDSPIINRKKQSNLRFVEETATDCFGKNNSTVFFTEEYKNGRWSYVSNSLSSTKEKAIELHLKLVDNTPVQNIKTKTIMWEGLDAEETKTWALISK